MNKNRHWQSATIPLTIDGVDLQVAAITKPGTGTPLVFLHGFGSTKEDYADLAWHPELGQRPVLAYDAPGCGATTCSDLEAISIPFLVKVAEAMIAHAGYTRYHLIGHSMGGLTALLLAHAHPEQLAGFIDIEGNIAPEDCFLSRQVIAHPTDDPERFLDEFIERTRRSPAFSAALYAAALRHKVRPGAVRGIFESMVELSDHSDLMTKFLSLPCPRMFMYGEQNASLSYLPTLAANGIELAEIADSSHWPIYGAGAA